MYPPPLGLPKLQRGDTSISVFRPARLLKTVFLTAIETGKADGSVRALADAGPENRFVRAVGRPYERAWKISNSSIPRRWGTESAGVSRCSKVKPRAPNRESNSGTEIAKGGPPA
jgi:hypothetical protein